MQLKTNNSWSIIYSMLMITILSSSCQDKADLLSTETPIELQSFESQVAYTHQNLGILAESLLKGSMDQSFKEKLYVEIQKKTLNEYSVLLETVIAESSNRFFNQDEVANAIETFKGIENTDYYPQLYIPYFDELQTRQRSENIRKKSTNTPMVIIFTHDEGQESFPGYGLNADGELFETGIVVDENYAVNNEVWVISNSERYFGDIVNSGTENTRTKASQSAFIDEVTCECHKESWAAGASEVNIITIFSNADASEQEVELYGGGNYSGGCIYKFSRKQVKRETTKSDLDYYVMNDWNDRLPNKPYANFVIFECDAWPTGKRDATWSLNSNKMHWEYRSGDGPYDIRTVANSSFNYVGGNYSCIEYYGSYRY